jgi:hypothetical protein
MADVEARDLFANEQDRFARQRQLFIERGDLRVKQTERRGQSRGMHFDRRRHFAELPASEVVGKFLYQSLRLFDRRKEGFHCLVPLKTIPVYLVSKTRKMFKQKFPGGLLFTVASWALRPSSRRDLAPFSFAGDRIFESSISQHNMK